MVDSSWGSRQISAKKGIFLDRLLSSKHKLMGSPQDPGKGTDPRERDGHSAFTDVDDTRLGEQ